MSPSESFSAKVYVTPATSYKIGVPESPSDVARIVEQAMEYISGSNVISRKVLPIEIAWPGYSRLALIDLPGYVQAAVADQPASVVQDIAEIVDAYVADKRTITLAVILANIDVATNRVATKVNQLGDDGKRTLGVITKPDLLDMGEDNKSGR
jgi:hypothetical protein